MALFDRRPGHPATGTQPPRYGVLLVDDEALNLSALAGLLEADYRVHTAGNASAALAMLADPRIAPGIQVVVSDQRMPGMTGVDLLTRVRTLRPDIKSLLFTGYNDMAAIITAINRAAVYGYLQKPIDIQDFKLALVRATEAWQLEQDNRELVAALSRSYEQLAMLDAAKTSFLRYLSHEVNTPLNWLAATTVIDRAALGEETARLLQYVDLGRERLYGLVAAVLRYFEVAGGELRLREQPVDIGAQVLELVDAQRRLHPDAVSIRIEQPAAVALQSDGTLLSELLEHLLENAVTHAVRDGGSSHVVVRVQAEGDGVLVEVHNSGRVPEPATLSQLFQPFFFCGSLHGSDGFGLSLATARALAHALGGSLEVDTRTLTGSGLCLRLQLPRHLPAARVEPAALARGATGH